MKTPWKEALLGREVAPETLRTSFGAALLESGSVSSVLEPPEDAARCEVVSAKGRTFTVQLGRLQEEARSASPGEREAIVRRHVATAIETARTLDGEAPAPSAIDVVPTVRSAAWVADSIAAAPDLATEPIAADLVLVYAFDRADSMAYATRARLDALGLSGERLRATALQNLRARLPAELGTRGNDQMFMFLAGGNYESSLILLDEVWDQLRETLKGDPVVCAVARDLCLVTSTGTPGGLQALMGARDHLCSGEAPPHFISTALLRRVGAEWVPLRAP